MSEFLIPLREPGLVKADFDFRVYRNAARNAADEAALTVTQLTPEGDYRVDNLPDLPRATWGTVTWAYPPGAGFAHSWPEQLGSPPSVVIPLRDSGHTVDEFEFKLYRGGFEDTTSTLALVELVPGGGDYAVSGWPVALLGERWLLAWQIGGIAFATSWTGTYAPPGGLPIGGIGSRRRLASVDRLVRHFGGGMAVVVRRRHSLRDGADGVPATLALVGAHPSGSATVTLALDRLDGALPPGLRLTVGATAYEVAGPAEVRAAGNRLVGVPLLAPLTTDLADGTPVEVEASRDYTFAAMATSRREDMPGTTDGQAAQVVVLSAVGAQTAPRPEDVVLMPGQATEEAIAVQAIRPGVDFEGWLLTPRGAAL